MRDWGTTINGENFSQAIVDIVWKKAYLAQGYDSNIYRRDVVGYLIKKDEYGNTSSRLGWEIDHIHPVSKNGSDELINLQPLQWSNNRDKENELMNEWLPRKVGFY